MNLRLNTIIITTLCAYLMCLYACQSGNQSTHAEHEQEHDAHGENQTSATLSPAQQQAIGLQLGYIEQKQLTNSLKLSGLLKVPNENKAQITAMYSGIVQTINIQVGNHVKKGQTVATISSPQLLQLQQDYLQAKIQAEGTKETVSLINQPQYAAIIAQLESINPQIEMAENEVKRQRILNEGNAGVMKRLQEAEAQLNTLNAQKRTLESQKMLFANNSNNSTTLKKDYLAQQLQIIGINPNKISMGNLQKSIAIVSPLSGVVSKIISNIGSSVDMTSPIAEIVDNNQLHLDLFVFEKDLPKLKVGQKIHFVLTNNAGKEYDAEIFGIGSTFESNTNNVAVHAHVEGNKEGLIDGMHITAIVSLEKNTHDVVPNQAIINYEGQDYIIVLNTEHQHANTEHQHANTEHQHANTEHQHANTEHQHTTASTKSLSFEKIPVRKGVSDIGYSEITLLKEIPKNKQIVTQGAFFVLAAMTNQGEGHQH